MDKCKSKSCAKEECDVEYLFALNRARERENASADLPYRERSRDLNRNRL